MNKLLLYESSIFFLSWKFKNTPELEKKIKRGPLLRWSYTNMQNLYILFLAVMESIGIYKMNVVRHGRMDETVKVR